MHVSDKQCSQATISSNKVRHPLILVKVCITAVSRKVALFAAKAQVQGQRGTTAGIVAGVHMSEKQCSQPANCFEKSHMGCIHPFCTSMTSVKPKNGILHSAVTLQLQVGCHQQRQRCKDREEEAVGQLTSKFCSGQRQKQEPEGRHT